MKPFDRLLQSWRIAQARPYLRPGSRVLDIGCGDGALLKRFAPMIAEGIGIDPSVPQPQALGSCRLIPGAFPEALGADTSPFDLITLLAVLEHIRPEAQRRVAERCVALLKPGGYLVATVPSPLVDHIVPVLQRLRIMDGTAFEAHHGFDPRHTPALFPGLILLVGRTFELGLNHAFVFQKSS